MKAIVPAAGIGSRLKPHTLTHPKVLLPVAGKPIIGHIMDRLIQAGVDEVAFIVGYLKEAVETYLRDNYTNIKMEFVEQAERKGLAHAVYLGLKDEDEQVLIILGDTIFEADLTPIVNGNTSSLGACTVEDPRRFGTIELENEQVVRLVEKPKEPKSNLVIVGIYYIANSGLLKTSIEEIMAENITVKNEYQITDALQRMIDHGERITTFPIDGWFDCGKPETLLATNKHLLEKLDNSIPETKNSVIIPPVRIPKSATIEGSIIGPYVSLGEESVVQNSIIRNSIIGDRTRVSNATLDSSIIGIRAVVEGYFKELNISDSSEIRFR